MRFFHPGQVTLLDGMFRDAEQVDLDYVMTLDPDRLVAPYLREAGLPPRADSYGNWESSGLDGHTAGHYLSATAWLALPAGRAEVRHRLDHVVAELSRAQDAIGTGYVGGVPGGFALFESLRAGGTEAAVRFGSSEHWVPWYNLHKMLSGLWDAVDLLGHDHARAVALRFAQWWLELAAEIDADPFENMLATEYGGMNDLFARMATDTGRADLAAMAHRFSHRAILVPLQERRDALTGLHANTQIPKVVGYATTAALDGDSALLGDADYFWHQVVERRSVVIGGNSVREHFHVLDDFTAMIEDREGPETCNTYNMLKLTKALAEAQLSSEYLDYAERALYSHQLAAQHPDGGFVYFTPMRPRHYRVYSQPESSFWCCVGTGMESQAKYGELIFGEQDGALAVNLFISAALDAPQLGTGLRMETGFPADEGVSIVVALDRPKRFSLRLRVPGWSGGLVDLAVNGRSADARHVDGAVILERDWFAEDVVTFRVPLEPRVERLPDGSPWQAYSVGPIVLAAREGGEDLIGLHADGSRMGHIAAGRLRGFSELPIVVTDAAGAVVPDPAGMPLHFLLTARDPAGDVSLEPFFGIHDERYTIYWPTAADDADAIAARRDALVTMDRGSLALDRLTVDAVAFGEQQPESDHEFRGIASRVQMRGGRRARSTRGAMSVILSDPGCEGASIRVGFVSGDETTRVAIDIDGVTVAEEVVERRTAAFDLVYPLVSTGPQHKIEFRATGACSTPGITMIRLLRWT
ncbi:beta-L-arabinofuranosidase domain-containing protein [Microbacterium pumilum]|uniref:Glycoside hydrolase family 127 protein n=1 Tax=Microbacterium pumilum TaxID=344165 RepID=A0ABP5D1Z0_9MICO